MNKMKRLNYMCTLKAVVSAALLSGLVSLLGSPPAHAALLTVGTSNHEFGGLVCADVKNATTTAGTAVQAYDCFGDLNEQFEFNGFTIYALGGTRCLDVSGTKVVSNTCTGAATQTWYYYNGEIPMPIADYAWMQRVWRTVRSSSQMGAVVQQARTGRSNDAVASANPAPFFKAPG
jgi:hypothetical protein